jgi:TldD protein
LTEIIRSKEQAISPVPDLYDVVFDGYAMAHLLGNIVGVATELDRALGWEANAGGTSYVAPIEDMLGARTFAAPLLNVSANRSRPGASATVKWDDEGISPENYTIVQDGALVDYHTTREFAPMLAPWYQRQKRSIRSHGCSASQTAKGIPLLQCPNIVMHPGKGTTTFEDLVKSMTKGIVVCGGNVFSDRQKLNGEVNGEFVYEVRNGKRVSVIGNSEILFRAPEILKNIAAIGGAGSQVDSGITVTKGQPEQEHSFGVTGVPALIKNVVLTDILRKS